MRAICQTYRSAFSPNRARDCLSCIWHRSSLLALREAVHWSVPVPTLAQFSLACLLGRMHLQVQGDRKQGNGGRKLASAHAPMWLCA